MTDVICRATGRILALLLPAGHIAFPGDCQFAVRIAGGAQTAAHRMQAELERRWFAELVRIYMLAVDFENAFNDRDRPAIAKILYSDPAYAPLFRFFHFVYSRPSIVITSEGAEILCANGTIQGEVNAMEAYCKSVDPVWTESREAGRAADPQLTCTAIADDGAFIGTFEGLKLALDKLLDMCAREGIKVNMPKFRLLDPLGDEYETPPEVIAWVESHGMQLEKGAMWHVGSPIGLDEAKRAQLAVAQVQKMQDKALSIIASPFFPAQCAATFAAQAVRGQTVHVASTAPVVATRAALDGFATALQGALTAKWLISSADMVDCKADVDAQLSIPTRAGGYGISPPNSAVLFFRSVARMHQIVGTLQPGFSLILPPPPPQPPPPPPLPPPPPDGAAAAPVPPPALADAVDVAALLPRLTPTVRSALLEFRKVIELSRIAAAGVTELSLFATLAHFQHYAGALTSKGLLTTTLQSPSFHIITKLLGKQETECLIAGRPRLLRRLIELSSDSARRFIPMLPRYGLPELFFPDGMYGDICRALLGIRHRNVPFDRPCKCLQLYTADHAHSCANVKSLAVADRHHALVHTLQRISNRAGIITTVEPKANHRLGPDSSSHRGDLLLSFTSKGAPKAAIMVDMAVLHGDCPSHQQKPIQNLLATRENEKVAKYKDVVNQDLVTFVPFVVSTLGSIAPQALLLLQKIASRAFDYGYTSDSASFFRVSVLSILSCVHRFNTRVQNQGVFNLVDPIACFMPGLPAAAI
jgi:hypothetical protein